MLIKTKLFDLFFNVFFALSAAHDELVFHKYTRENINYICRLLIVKIQKHILYFFLCVCYFKTNKDDTTEIKNKVQTIFCFD